MPSTRLHSVSTSLENSLSCLQRSKAFRDIAIQFAACESSFSSGELSSGSQFVASHGMRHSHPAILISVSHHSSLCFLCTQTNYMARMFQDQISNSVYGCRNV